MKETGFFSRREFVDEHSNFTRNSRGKPGRQCRYCSMFWRRGGRSYFKRVERHVSSMHPDDFQRAEERHESWVNWVRQGLTQEEFFDWLEIQENRR